MGSMCSDQVRPPSAYYLVGMPTSKKKCRNRSRIYLGGLFLLLLGIGCWVMLTLDGTEVSDTFKKMSSLAPQKIKRQGSTSLRVPRIVQSAHHDPAYAAGHPGWERYYTAGLEFRLYSKSSNMQAIQVIARGDISIPLPFFQSFFDELSSERPLSPTERLEKNGIYIEGGKGDGDSDYMVYRRKGDQHIRAFIISLPGQN